MRVLLFLFMFLFAVSVFAADVTVAKVGKVNISEKEVNIILNDIVMKQGIDPRTIDQNNPKVAEVKNDIVKNLVQREILLTLAMKSIPKDIDKKTSESYENLKEV